MKKYLFAVAVALLSMTSVNAQTNIQLHFDTGSFLYQGKNGKKSDLSRDGSNRQFLTATIEHFNADRFGSNYFFVDLDFASPLGADGKSTWSGVRGAYTEIGREWCFWKGTKLEGLSAHMEYDGGLDRYSGSYNDAWLFGPTYSIHNGDYSFTASLSALYKVIPGNTKSKSNFQITGVWGYHFLNRMLSFSGFFDVWMENRPWQLGAKGDKDNDGTDFIFISEPQFWFNLNAVCEDVNLSFGTEIELSNNFVGTGFYCCPTIAAKYTF